MVLTSDFAGGWRLHGEVTPKFLEWSTFSIPSNSQTSVIRLTFHGNLANVKSFGYLRIVYDTGEDTISPRQAFYVSDRSVLIDLRIPNELLISAEVVPRSFEITKELLRRYVRYSGLIQDVNWSVSIEALETPSIPDSIILAWREGRILNAGSNFILLPRNNP